MRITWPSLLLFVAFTFTAQSQTQTVKAPKSAEKMIPVQGGVLPVDSRFKDTTIESFSLSKTETTWGDWQTVQSFAEKHGYDLKKARANSIPDHPVDGVGWFDAVKWCNAKSEMEGLVPVYITGGSTYKKGNVIPGVNPKADGYRLPSGAEWEWAARGGASSQGFTYSGGNDLNKVAWNWNNSAGAKQDMSDGRGTWPVARKDANELGFYDMSGNVAEWSGDEVSGPFRGIRGGAWYGSGADCAVKASSFSSAEAGSNFIGFRIARGGKIAADDSTPEITFTSNTTLPSGKIGSTYDAAITVQGGISPVHLAVKNNTPMPSGLVFANNRVTGIPTASGSFAFTLVAEDSVPSLRHTAEQSFSIDIASYGLEISPEPAAISGKVKEPLTVTLTATGGEAPLKWTAPEGVPRGLILDAATGVLSGAPSRPETATLNLRVTDSKGFSAARSIPISFTTDPLQISQNPPPSAMAGVDLLWQLEAKGGLPPYKFALAPGSTLPAGMYLSNYNPAGRVVGKSKAEGSHSVKIILTDSLALSAEQEFTLRILPYDLAIAEIPTSIEGKYGVAVSQQLNATGGVPPYTWSASNELPSGITLNATSGLIQGTPNTVGSFVVDFKVTDSNFKSVTKNTTFQIIADPVSISVSSLPPAKAGTPYSAEISTTGGILPVSLSLKTSSTLPAGLTLSKGKLTGTPSAAGSFSFSLVAEDSNPAAKSVAEQSFNLEIESYGMEIAPEPVLISGKVNEPISVSFKATGGKPPYKWSAIGNLPRGLSINATTGVFAGTPMSLVSNTVTIRVTDTTGFPVMRSIPISITADPLTLGADATASTMMSSDFLWQIPVKGGLPPYKIALAAGGKLPAGLYLSEYAPHGRILGEPTATGSFTFKVVAKDSLGQETEGDVSITVTPYDLAIADIPATQAKYNELVKISPSVSGGVPPIFWSVQGALPKGLSINPSNGEISGKPSVIGDFDFVVKVTDSKRKSFTKNASIGITSDPLAITTAALPAAKAGVPFSAEITTGGGILPVNVSLKNGENLPPGLNLAKGKISGTPTAAGSFSFTILAQDSNTPTKSQVEQTYSLEIPSYGMEIAQEPSLISGKLREQLSVTFTAAGGDAPYKWSASGDLPRGLAVDATTGVLSGTPVELKTGSILVRATDAAGFPCTRSVPISITTEPLEIIHEPAPEARPGADFKWGFQVKGGLSPRPLKLAPESTLPPGLYLSFSGTSARIQGKPRSEGSFNFTLIAEDAGSEPAKKDLVLVVSSKKPEIPENPLHVAITTESLPTATVGTAYNQVIEISGGIPPLKLALKEGSQLPTGLLIVREKISGIPSTAGNHSFTLTATDIQGSSKESTLTLTVSDKPMQIAGPRNAKGEEFKPFRAELRVNGGKAPYVWSTRSGLPSGLTLNASTGILSGHPSQGTAGNHSVAVQVTDADSRASAGLFAFVITKGQALSIVEKTLPTALINTPYRAKLTTKGGNSKTLRWSLESGQLPTGLSLNSTTGEIFGTPTQQGSGDIILKVEDASGNSCVQLMPMSASVEFSPGMVFVLGGKLPIGSPLGDQLVTDFYLSRYELTWGEWKKTCVTSTARGYDISKSGDGNADDHPVRDITWYDAVKWCNLKSENEGLTPVYTVKGAVYKKGIESPEANLAAHGYRLPTELEWEWAARGGVSSRGFNFSGANELDSVAWHAGNSPSGASHSVGAKMPNELGLQDMSGNVQEWCWDSYKNYRRVRGGSYKDDSFACAITNSDFTIPDRASQNVGFRPAQSFKK